VKAEDAVRGPGLDLLAIVAHRGRDPGRLHRDLGVLDVCVAPG
jgi:hypothetical protein